MEQGRADGADAEQVWREKQAGEEYNNTGETQSKQTTKTLKTQ